MRTSLISTSLADTGGLGNQKQVLLAELEFAARRLQQALLRECRGIGGKHLQWVMLAFVKKKPVSVRQVAL